MIHNGTPLNGHSSTADTCDISDNAECLDCIYIEFDQYIQPHLKADSYLIILYSQHFGEKFVDSLVNQIARRAQG